MAKETGGRKRKKLKTPINIRLPAPLLERVDRLAQQEDRTRTVIIEEALRLFLNVWDTVGPLRWSYSSDFLVRWNFERTFATQMQGPLAQGGAQLAARVQEKLAELKKRKEAGEEGVPDEPALNSMELALQSIITMWQLWGGMVQAYNQDPEVFLTAMQKGGFRVDAKGTALGQIQVNLEHLSEDGPSEDGKDANEE